jgi:exopolyphosphatase/guanosine-5'-triphosphate,3'-diphosphate pyrophosphatase
LRVAVVDIGTNSTRLLIADVDAGRIAERDRRTTVTRLGAGVDATGRLADDARARVLAVLDAYHEAIEAAGCDATAAVLTSAARDAANGAQFADEVRRRYGLDARTIDGDTEAALTFLGATAERAHDDRQLVVVDVGGGSTEFVSGRGGVMSFHVSTQAGVVRQTERHMRSDPPRHDEMEALADDVRSVFHAAIPPDVRAGAEAAIAVAGTATSAAAIDQQLEPYRVERVQGYRLELGACELILARLAAMPLARRREVPGLHPERAPTIVAGVAILIEAMRVLGLDAVEVSEHDILWGVALSRAADAGAA